jgi:hypothetical protein
MSRPDFASRQRILAWTVSLGWALVAPVAIGADATTPPVKAATPKASTKAAAQAREGGFGKSNGPLLTREQLRQCLTEQDRLKQEAAEVVQVQRTLESERAEIDRTGVELTAGKETLDRTSQAAIDAFNAKIQSREKQVEAYRLAAPAFNDRVDKLDTAKRSFAKDCADRRYHEDDYDAIKAGK